MTLDKIIILEKKNDEHGIRMSSLESTRSYAFGVLAAIAAFFGLIGSFIGKAIASIAIVH